MPATARTCSFFLLAELALLRNAFCWLDACALQAPVMAARTADEALLFATKLKDMNTACQSTARIAVTGSGMVALLNTIRSIAPNGSTLWSAMSRVHLGSTPPAASVAGITQAIIRHRAAAGDWSAEVIELVTPHHVVERLTPAAGHAQLTAPRPALVAYLADLMGSADSGPAAEVEASAFSALVDKLIDEAERDAVKALAELSSEQRALVFSLSTGRMKRSEMVVSAHAGRQRSFMQVLDTVCQPPASRADDTVVLLAPYAGVMGSMLAEGGTMLVVHAGKE